MKKTEFPAWLMVVCLAILVAILWKSAHAATAIECYWQACDVSTGIVNVSLCSLVQKGPTEKMFTDERRSRGRGKLFLRECVMNGEKPVVTWAWGSSK